MEFRFELLSKRDDEIAVMMYGTEYRLVKNGEQWVNKVDNKMSMSAELADAIVASVFSQ